MDIRRTLLILIAFVIIAFVQALPIKEIKNPERINDGANAFEQHKIGQLWSDSDFTPLMTDSDCKGGQKCSSDDDCCLYLGSRLSCDKSRGCLVPKEKGSDWSRCQTPSFWEKRGGNNKINNNHRGKWERGHRKTKPSEEEKLWFATGSKRQHEI